MARALGVTHVLRVDASGRIDASAAFKQRLEPGSLAGADATVIAVDAATPAGNRGIP